MVVFLFPSGGTQRRPPTVLCQGRPSSGVLCGTAPALGDSFSQNPKDRDALLAARIEALTSTSTSGKVLKVRAQFLGRSDTPCRASPYSKAGCSPRLGRRSFPDRRSCHRRLASLCSNSKTTLRGGISKNKGRLAPYGRLSPRQEGRDDVGRLCRRESHYRETS